MALAADDLRVASVVAETTGDYSHVTMWSARTGATGRLDTLSGACAPSPFSPLSIGTGYAGQDASIAASALAGERAATVINEECRNTVCGLKMVSGTFARSRVDVIFDDEFDRVSLRALGACSRRRFVRSWRWI